MLGAWLLRLPSSRREAPGAAARPSLNHLPRETRRQLLLVTFVNIFFSSVSPARVRAYLPLLSSFSRAVGWSLLHSDSPRCSGEITP